MRSATWLRRPRHRHELGKIVDRYHSALADVLERGRATGVLRFDDLRSTVQAVHALCAGWATGANYLKNISKEIYWREIAGIVEGRFFVPAEAISKGQAR